MFRGPPHDGHRNRAARNISNRCTIATVRHDEQTSFRPFVLALVLVLRRLRFFRLTAIRTPRNELGRAIRKVYSPDRP